MLWFEAEMSPPCSCFEHWLLGWYCLPERAVGGLAGCEGWQRWALKIDKPLIVIAVPGSVLAFSASLFTKM